MDDALLLLNIRPNLPREDYFSHKMNYALSTLVVTYHEGKFLYVHASYARLTHNNQVFFNSKLSLHPDMFF